MKSPHIPLTHALAWIVGSMLFVNGISYSCFKYYMRKRISADRFISSIVQTGPQKEALKTEYLAEILGICADRPVDAAAFNLKKAERTLCATPFISRAKVSLIKPSTLYIDYTVRKPIAHLADFENVAIDKEGYPFPFTPFFSPKNLPKIYLGTAPFGIPSNDSDKPMVQWGHSLQGKYLDIALMILACVTDPAVADCFNVQWIDVSHAFSHSCGSRELVLITEDTLFLKEKNSHIVSNTLRLSTKHYAQELANFLTLRKQLLEQARAECTAQEHLTDQNRVLKKIIDFRIPNLAFIETEN